MGYVVFFLLLGLVAVGVLLLGGMALREERPTPDELGEGRVAGRER
jgi:hypothetical protein